MSKGCKGCKYVDYVEDADGDGHVNWSNSGFICMGNSRPGLDNLKSFPFTKKEMPCHSELEAADKKDKN